MYEAKGELASAPTTIERFGLGDHLAAIERLKRALAAEGLFAAERKRPLPRFPRAIGVLTGADAAARGDVVTGIRHAFPPAHIVVAETRVQGAGRGRRHRSALRRVAAHPAVDVVIVARGGGSFEDLLPFSDERVVRAFAACPVPVVSAVGHEQDTPLCDLAADVRASTPDRGGAPRRPRPRRASGRARPAPRAASTDRSGARSLATASVSAAAATGSGPRRAPAGAAARRTRSRRQPACRRSRRGPRSARGYAIVRADGVALRDTAACAPGASSRSSSPRVS